MSDADTEHFKALIKKVATEHQLTEYSVKVQALNSGGANYTSRLYSVTIQGDKQLNLFAKVAAVGEKLREQGPKVYEIEIFAYTKLVKIYERLEEQLHVPKEHRVAFTKYYGCIDEALKEVMLLEDLTSQGFNSFDRFKSVDWEYASSAVKEMAKMHALSYAYREYNPEDYKEVLKNVLFDWLALGDSLTLYFEQIVRKAVSNVKEENREKMVEFCTGFSKEALMAHYKAKSPVLIHGDYRPSNLMHRRREDGSIEIKIVDLQTLQGGSPIVDLLYFIFTGSDEQFRAEYYSRLVEHYYVELCAALSRFQLKPDEIYSRDQFYAELEEKLPFGLSIAIFSLPVITVEAENAPKVDEITEASSFSIEKTSDLYTERLNGIVNDYVKWGILK